MESMTERIATPLKFFSRLWALLAAVVLLGVMATTSGAAEGQTTLVSVDSSGNQGNDDSLDEYGNSASMSADGRFVAFVSEASNLVANDTNDHKDVFVRDLQTGITQRVSVDGSGNQVNSGSRNPSISSDGRFVAFSSGASKLAPNDTNGAWDVFVRDLQLGTTDLVSIDTSGNQGDWHSSYPSISSDGRFVAFWSSASNLVSNDTNGASDVFVRDRQEGTTQRVSVDSSGNQANKESDAPSISPDGRFVAFSSVTGNLVAGDTNGWRDVFVRDLQAGTTERVSVSSSGNQANGTSSDPSISKNGRYVAFHSRARNLVRDDTNGAYDVFVRDLQAGTTRRASVDSSGNQANARRYGSYGSSISSGGRLVAFYSYASNLVANDTNGTSDVFVRDLQRRITQRVSVDSSGNQAFGFSPSISSDGRLVAFVSAASNLVANDSNGAYDVFVHERDATAPKVRRVVPSEGATNVALKADVVASFSERMAKNTLNKSNFKLYKLVKNPNGTTTAKRIESVTVTPSSDGLKATLDPYGNTDGQLAKNTRYKAVVSTGALDVFGNRLDQQPGVSGNQPKVWYFKTRG